MKIPDIRLVILDQQEAANQNGLENVAVFMSKAEEDAADIQEEIDEDKAAIVYLLEKLMMRALKGELKGFAYVTVSQEDSVGTGWEGNNCRYALGHGTGTLQYRYQQANVEQFCESINPGDIK